MKRIQDKWMHYMFRTHKFIRGTYYEDLSIKEKIDFDRSN